jgi:FkbH-like protein
MRVRVEGIREANFERVNQLLNKTNQFNLTTRRYSGAELRAIVDDAAWSSITLSLRDRLGDSGLISVILLRREGEAVWIDTWLMSCRVLQRQVEQFALNEIVRRARALGARRIHGEFVPTSRNQLVASLYADLGFRTSGGDGKSAHWVLELDDTWVPLATHIERESMNA